jgi:segregation and condensation protein B
MDAPLQRQLEALIFCSPAPVPLADLQACLSELSGTELPEETLSEALGALSARYASPEYAFELLQLGGGYQFLTKPAYQDGIGLLLKQQSKKRLSRSALETLAIVAYKQPVTKGQLEQIRGVNCDYAVKKLLDKQLIEIRGKSEGIGRPVLYGTSAKFLAYFGINDLRELPTLKDFAEEEEAPPS